MLDRILDLVWQRVAVDRDIVVSKKFFLLKDHHYLLQ